MNVPANIWVGHKIDPRPDVIDYLRHAIAEEPTLHWLQQAEYDPQDWGGAGLHFSGTWSEANTPVLLKLNASPRETVWFPALAHHDPDLVPKTYAVGDHLGELQLPWIAMERLPTTLNPLWNGDEFRILIETGVRFHLAAKRTGITGIPRWGANDIESWITSAQALPLPGDPALLLGSLRQDWSEIVGLFETEILHADLHLANVLSRSLPPTPSLGVAIDFQPTRAPWILEAVYPEFINKGRPGADDLALVMRAARAARHLPVPTEEQTRRGAIIAMAWTAMKMWPWFGHDAEPDEPVWENTRRAVDAHRLLRS